MTDPSTVHVTTGAPDGPGSLAEALRQEGPRTIVFDIPGTFFLDGPVPADVQVVIDRPFVTLVGNDQETDDD